MTEPFLDLLVPWAGASDPSARAALDSVGLPQLQALLRQLKPGPRVQSDALARSLPHEAPLARALGLPDGDGLTPWAALAAWDATPAAERPAIAQHAWAWITPCHFRIGADQVQLGHASALPLDESDSRTLLAILQDFFAEDGITLHYQEPLRWLARGAQFRDLPSTALDKVAGRNVQAWLTSTTPQERQLRRLQSETQMLLYTHPFNDARSERGLPVVNGFWVHGSGALPTGWQPPAQRPQVDERLRAPALQGDWKTWAQAWQALDAGPLADLLAQARTGKAVRLTLCGEQDHQSWASAPRSLGQRIQGFFRPQSPKDVLYQL